jgi:hypothetical protein
MRDYADKRVTFLADGHYDDEGEIPMNRIAVNITLLLLSLGVAAMAQNTPTLTVINQASDSASVRVVGPTAGYLQVASGMSHTVAVSGGTYHLKVRYCDSRGHCHYSKTDSFTVTQTASSVSQISVTLRAAGGNLNEENISESEFSGSH